QALLEERYADVLEALRLARQSAGPVVLLSMIMAAVLEELFFRGFLFNALRARAGPWVTIGVTGVLFGLTHVFLGGALGLHRLLPSTALGLILGWVCWTSGSVWPGMALHVCHNVVLT